MLFFSKESSSLGKRAAALVLTLVMLLSVLPPHAEAASARIIRVGLFFGSNALPTANLANEVGSGYQFGSFSSDGTFTAVGSTAVEKITVCKQTNLYLSGGSFYETPTSSAYTLIGAYHLQASGTYASFQEAQAATASYPSGFPAYVNGAYVVRFEFYSTAANAAADAGKYSGASVVGSSPTCYTVVETATGSILFEYDAGGDYFGILPTADSSETAQTWFKGYRYYGGFQYARRSGNDLTVVNFVSEDLYVEGVLPYEFVGSGGIESLKAGAVAIRTFARATRKHLATYGFDVCNTDDCQVYHGVYTDENADNINLAATSTAGQYIYYNGAPIQALYFASDGGCTEDSENAWGGEYSYLAGKEDPYEATISFPSQSWTYTVTPAQVKAMLSSLGYNCGNIVGLAVTETTSLGNVNKIVITDDTGDTFTFKQDNVRILRNISGITYFSRHFTIKPLGGTADTSAGTGFSVYDGTSTTTRDSVTVITGSGNTTTVSAPATVITGSGTATVGTSESTSSGTGWVISGGGYGHNIGMSQWGAYAMAKQGYTYKEILQFYYTGVTIK